MPSSRSTRASRISRTCSLYLITPPDLGPGGAEAFAESLGAALAAGEVACVQLRLKDVDDEAVRAAARVLAPVVQSRDVAFIMNDRPDLAVETGCDGVHIGQEDVGYAEARRIVGPDATVGVTCKDSYHLAMEAAEAGADYVAFGAFFPSTTKEAAVIRAPFEVLRNWQTFSVVPCVAIGGITVANCAAVVEAGADFLAVGGGVWNYPAGPAAAVRDFNEEIARVLAGLPEDPWRGE